MSTRLGRMIRDWRYWRAARDWKGGDGYPAAVPIPMPEPKLNVRETFLHLKPWQRIACVICCGAAYVLCIQSTLVANVGPHLVKDEFREAFRLGAFVVLLTATPLLIRQAPGLVSKLGLSLMALFMAYATLNNACNVQKDSNETRRDAPRQKAEKIARLDKKITGLKETFEKAEKPAKRTTGPMVAVLQKQADELTKSAADECKTGSMWGSNRGPKCLTLEKQRNEKLAEVATLQADKDRTDMLVTIEGELWKAQQDRDNEGAAPAITGKELERLPAILADFGVPQWFAQALSDHNPETDSMGMELVAMFGAPAAVILVFKLFALLACTKTEADKRMIEVLGSAKVALSAVPYAERSDIATEMQPDHSPEAALGIIGDELPAFAKNPQTVAEAVAAATLKADPHKSFERRAREPREASKDSLRQFWKEMVLDRPGCSTSSTRFISRYEAWCHEKGVKPISPQLIGRVLREEFGITKAGKGRSNYQNIDLRPVALRVVA